MNFGWTILIKKEFKKKNNEKNSDNVDSEQALFIKLN